MKIKYVGNRSIVSIMCSGRKNYVFYADNNFTQEVTDAQHAAQILRSVQHSFEVLPEAAPKVSPKIAPIKTSTKEKPLKGEK